MKQFLNRIPHRSGHQTKYAPAGREKKRKCEGWKFGVPPSGGAALRCDYVRVGISLAPTQPKAARGIARMAQDARPSLAFTSALAQFWTSAISHFSGLLRTSLLHWS